MLFAHPIKILSDFYNHDKSLPEYLLWNTAYDDYRGFSKIIMYFDGDEIFSAEAPEYEKLFLRCSINDYTIHIEPGLFHTYPMFPFVKEGKQGENDIIEHLKK